LKPSVAALFAMPGNTDLAGDLAVLTGLEAGSIETRRFPDAETYVRVRQAADEESFLVCTLARPDEQFIPLILGARAIRQSGAKRLSLIAPYLAYLRQDRQFKEGEAVSSQVFADLVSREFDALVTVDPHLHRYASLSEIYRIPTTVVHTSKIIGNWIRENVRAPVVMGPDKESAQWVEEVARQAACPWAVFQKERQGDRDIRLTPPNLDPFDNSTPVIIDDIVSSGATMMAAAKILLDAGIRPGFCIAVHALFDEQLSTELASLFDAVLTSDSIPNRFSRFQVAPLIAERLA
jgi:ribose-phosphate pyrophosphokinase